MPLLDELSPAARRALEILSSGVDFTAKEFASKMWPDSDGWDRVSNAGTHGSRSGAGMWRAGGSFLSVLRARGYVIRMYSSHHQALYGLSSKGTAALAQVTKEAAQ